MKGQWIWPADAGNTENQMGCFIQKFALLEQLPCELLLRICARTRYVVWLNGSEIGRGPIRSLPEQGFYDTYDILPYINLKDNFLAVRVWDYGYSTYQSISCEPGLIFELEADGKVFCCSGQGTKSMRDPGIKYNTVKRNANLGFMENYDAAAWDPSWIFDQEKCTGFQESHLAKGQPEVFIKRTIPYFDCQDRYPKKIAKWQEVKRGCSQITVNVRDAFFPGRRDADETIFSGFIGTVLEVSEDTKGVIAFPNRTWHGLIGDFKINGKLYQVSNQNREVPVALKRGKQLFLLQVSGKYDDLYCHIEFKFEQEIKTSPLPFAKSDFFVIGPTGKIDNDVSGFHRIYGGLKEYNRMEEHTAEHKSYFEAGHINDIMAFRSEITEVAEEYIFRDEYILSLVRNEVPVALHPVTEDKNGMLWANTQCTEIPVPTQGDCQQIILDFADLYVGALEFTLSAAEGTMLDIYCFENMFEGISDFTIGLNNAMRYHCKEGVQTYTTMSRIGCRFACITIRSQREPVKFYHFKIKDSHYPTAEEGQFRCSDEALNRIWKMSSHTHELCMEDVFTDCPTYEQAFWIGDAFISANVNQYLFGSYDLIRHCLTMAATASSNTPMWNALTPTDWNTSIPMWAMNWVTALEAHELHTGDDKLLEELYPMLRDMLTYYGGFVREDGAFLLHAWNMLDWAAMDIENHGVVTGQQGLLAYCFRFAARLAKRFGSNLEEQQFNYWNDKLLNYLDTSLWDEKKQAYVDGFSPEFGFSKTISMQTHALLILYDACIDQKKRVKAEELLRNPPKDCLTAGSPFILFYIYECFARQGRLSEILEDIKEKWGMMLRYDSTTCWEVFPGFYEASRTRSYCHSWSSLPVYFISKYLLGVHVSASGYRQVEIHMPDTSLTWCSGSIPTPFGRIMVYWDKEQGKHCRIELPKEIKAVLPTDNGWKIEIINV